MTLKSDNPNLDCFKNLDISLHRVSRVLLFSSLRKYSVRLHQYSFFLTSFPLVRMLLALIGHLAVPELSPYDNDSLVGVFRSTEHSKLCFPWAELKL